jgi:2-hydroxy-3-keto-5-methylthiopentenyl-1-phosphate phosphatase
MKDIHIKNKQKIVEMGEKLLSKKSDIREKTVIMMTLAHSPTKEALDILNQYSKNPDLELKDMLPFAIEECEWWNE